jgi:hypothetical protein
MRAGVLLVAEELRKKIQAGSVAKMPHVFRLAQYAFWGGATGLVGSLGTAFVLGVCEGYNRGLSLGGCVVNGAAVTLLFSHPIGFAGIAAGATAGAITGGAVYTVRSVARHLHRPSSRTETDS